MLKRLVSAHYSEGLTIGKLYDINEAYLFLDDDGDIDWVTGDNVFEEAPNAPQPKADMIKAWADGWDIEVQPHHNGRWSIPSTQPHWFSEMSYRIAEPKTVSERQKLIDCLQSQIDELKRND